MNFVNASTFFQKKFYSRPLAALSVASLAILALGTLDGSANALPFSQGDLVLSIYGNGDGSGSYTDNQASPIVLKEVTTSGSSVGQMTLPQTAFGANSAISGEYGSSSEGTLQRSTDGHSLSIMGYGVNAQTFNQGGAAVYGSAALAQTTSLTTQSTFTPVSRVVANIKADGTVDTSTSLYNVSNTNNPRSVATVDGSAFYVSGQGVKGDTTEGVFYAKDGAHSATAIDTSHDTRTVEITNNQLYVSVDSKVGPGVTANISSYGSIGNLPSSATSPSILPGISNSITLSANQTNTVNGGLVGSTVFLSPENFFFASPTTLYVADSGNPKADDQGSRKSSQGLGVGGLQKWVLKNNVWQLEYTLSEGLGLVSDTAIFGTTGLIGLTGQVIGDQVALFATNATLCNCDETYLYGITDFLSSTTGIGESFTALDAAAPDTVIRGVAFAPTSAIPEPSSFGMLAAGLLGFFLLKLSRHKP